MAIMFPTQLTGYKDKTKGEERIFKLLKKALNNDWLCWYDVKIGEKGKYPDFLMVNKENGLFILEVKDWRANAINKMNNDFFEVYGKSYTNPLKQAREYIFHTINHLSKDKNLLQTNENYKNRFILAYGYGVAFPYITNEEFFDNNMNKIINRKHIILQDDFTNIDKLEDKIISWIPSGVKKRTLDLPTLERIRAKIFPEIIIPTRKAISNSNSPQDDEEKPLLLDLPQEIIVRSIGEGHRLLKGIAGSGKTLVMIYRAKLLARENPNWKILLLCFNVTLANFLRQMYNHINIEVENENNIEILHFSEWLRVAALKHNIGKEKNQDFSNNIDYLTKNRTEFILNYSSEVLYKYDAILIDEAQDLEDSWIKAILRFLNTKSNNLILCIDEAQNIYKRKHSWKEIGINVWGRGKSKRLKTNYRNTRQITQLGFYLYKEDIPEIYSEDNNDSKNFEMLKRDCDYPELKIFNTQLKKSRSKEINEIIDWINKIHAEKKVNFRDILIQYPKKNHLHKLLNQLDDKNIPYDWITEDRKSKMNFDLTEDSIKISTIHSSKGMDFHASAIIFLDEIEGFNSTDKITSISYVAITRARDYLLITGNQCEILKRLEIALEKVKEKY